MKIKELKNLLTEIIGTLNYNYEEISQPNNIISKFSHLIQFRNSINLIDECKLFSNEISLLRKSPIFSTAKDSLEINYSEGRDLKIQTDEIIKLVDAINQTIADISIRTSDDSISIKLPPINDFEDLAKVSSEFNKILNQAIVNDDINGQVKIESVENGSIWIDVYLGSAAAVALIGGLSWAAAVVFKKFQEGKIIEEHVKSLGIKNESIKEIQIKQKDALDLLIDAEANNLYNENFTGENNEQIERLKNSIKLLSQLIDKGAEIHPALNQPENVKNLFPKMELIKTIESKIKRIE